MKLKISREILLLMMVLVLAGFLRFWQLGKVPASPDWDEAALGYNAYSILKTGKDEYGQFLPVILRSFDDYKPALYAYLAIPAVKIFGLNTFAVRFPSAVLGTLAILATYFLCKELFRKSPLGTQISLLASLLLAISPWHLQFSRAAFESSIGMFFNILLALFFLKGLKKPGWLLLSAFFAGLNIHVYQAEKVFGPLLIFALVLIWRKELFRLPWKYLFLAILVGLILVLPFFYSAITTPEIFLRAKGTSFASDVTPFLSRTVEKLARDQEHQDYLGLILDNRRITYVLAFVGGYLSHFDFNWLFVRGDDTRHHAPGMGLLYLWELPFLLLGIYHLVFGEYSRKSKLLIFTWFLLAPFPAAFSSGAPHAVRAMRFLPVMQILVALGLVSFWLALRKQKTVLRILIYFFCFLFFVFNFAYYLDQYFVQLNYSTSHAWQYGYEEVVKEVKSIEGDFDKIIVSNKQPMDQSYMFFLFYLQYDPAAYQKEGGTYSGGYAEENHFGKFIFKDFNWASEEKNRRTLFVGRLDDFPGGESIPEVKNFNYLNGNPAIRIMKGL